jgi:hypothetical protein
LDVKKLTFFVQKTESIASLCFFSVFPQNSARRIAELALVLQPVIGKNLKIEIPTTTNKPVKSESSR